VPKSTPEMPPSSGSVKPVQQRAIPFDNLADLLEKRWQGQLSAWPRWARLFE
jgi:hypothetical protein